VLLAAGSGSRFGQPKALVELNGATLAERGVELLRTGGADPVLVVAGAAEVQIDGAHTVHNPEWRTGMGSSLRAALTTLSGPMAPAGMEDTGMEDTDVDDAGRGGAAAVGAAVIALADQPLVGAEAVRRLIEAYRAGATVAVASYAGQPRNPGRPRTHRASSALASSATALRWVLATAAS
jgi:CTP:molybdopterin cytidylyltransferase MocA